MLKFDLVGRWDELSNIATVEELNAYLCEVAGVDELTPKATHPPKGPSSVTYGTDFTRLDYGAPTYSLEDFEQLSLAYAPAGLSGLFTVCGIDTADNSYPTPEGVAIDKQGNPLTLELTPTMSAFDISVAVVALADSHFDGFPHHHWFEGLDIDPVACKLYFNMGS